MMIMRENLKKSMFQSFNNSMPSPPSSLDLSISPKMKPRYNPESSGFVCGDCGRTYKLKSSLRNHQKWECGKDPQFKCPYCVYKAKQKMHMARHMERMHRDIGLAAMKAELKSEDDNDDSETLHDYSMVKNVQAEIKGFEEEDKNSADSR